MPAWVLPFWVSTHTYIKKKQTTNYIAYKQYSHYKERKKNVNKIGK